MKKLKALIFSLFVSITPLLVAQVDESEITTFQAGAPASAAEVNQNFQALIDAINQNAIAIQNINNGGNPTPSLDDSIFAFKGIGVATGVKTDSLGDHMVHDLLAIEATLTLNGNNTFSWTEAQFLDKRTRITSEHMGVNPTTATELETAPASVNGTWSLDGQILTLNGLDLDGVFHVSLAADTISVMEIYTEDVSVGEIDSNVGIHSAFVLIGTRVQ